MNGDNDLNPSNTPGPLDPLPGDPLPGDPLPMNEAPLPEAGGPVAERFVDKELKDARKSLLYNQIGSVLAVILLGGYTMYLTNGFRKSLEPKEAATIAQGLVSQKLEQQGPQLATYVKEEVPKYIRQAPDYVLKELPNYRQQIQTRANDAIAKYAKDSSERLSTQIDEFLEKNKDSVGALIKNGQDPTATAKINEELKGVFVKYLEDTSAGGESLKAKLDQALTLLTQANERMNRLATSKSLTPQEQNARRAIAVLLKQIDLKRIEEGRTDAIAPKAIEDARGPVTDAVNNAADRARDTANNVANAVGNATAPSSNAPSPPPSNAPSNAPSNPPPNQTAPPANTGAPRPR